MWVKEITPIEGKEYSVMDSLGFMQKAVFQNGEFINPVTKNKIQNIIRIWEQ